MQDNLVGLFIKRGVDDRYILQGPDGGRHEKRQIRQFDVVVSETFHSCRPQVNQIRNVAFIDVDDVWNGALGREHMLGDAPAHALHFDSAAGCAEIELGFFGNRYWFAIGYGRQIGGEVFVKYAATRARTANLYQIDPKFAGEVADRRRRLHGGQYSDVRDRFLLAAIGHSGRRRLNGWLGAFVWGLAVVRQDYRADFHLLPRLRFETGYRTAERSRHFHGRLVGHYFHQALAVLHAVTGLYQPAHEFGLVYTFTKFWQRKIHNVTRSLNHKDTKTRREINLAVFLVSLRLCG